MKHEYLTNGACVYLVSTGTGLHKIGVSKTPGSRLGQLQTGCPFPLHFVGATTCVDAGGVSPWEMERRVHTFLAHYQTSGEWFDAAYEIVYSAWRRAWCSLARPDVLQRWEYRTYGRRSGELRLALDTQIVDSEPSDPSAAPDERVRRLAGERQKRWREKNRERYNEYMRGYRKRKRDG